MLTNRQVQDLADRRRLKGEQELQTLPDRELLKRYGLWCARRGVRNSGLCIFLSADAREPDYEAELLRRLRVGAARV